MAQGRLVWQRQGSPAVPTLGPGPRAAWCSTSEQGATLAAHICSVQGVAQNLSIHGYCLDTELSGGIQGLDTLDTGELVSTVISLDSETITGFSCTSLAHKLGSPAPRVRFYRLDM